MSGVSSDLPRPPPNLPRPPPTSAVRTRGRAADISTHCILILLTVSSSFFYSFLIPGRLSLFSDLFIVLSRYQLLVKECLDSSGRAHLAGGPWLEDRARRAQGRRAQPATLTSHRCLCDIIKM